MRASAESANDLSEMEMHCLVQTLSDAGGAYSWWSRSRTSLKTFFFASSLKLFSTISVTSFFSIKSKSVLDGSFSCKIILFKDANATQKD